MMLNLHAYSNLVFTKYIADHEKKIVINQDHRSFLEKSDN